jgi:hypothetical protein
MLIAVFRVSFFVIALLFGFSGVIAQSPAASTGDEVYRVYSAVIGKMFAGDKVTFDTQAKIKQVVIRDYTTTDYASGGNKERWEQVRMRMPGLLDETIAEYETRLKRPIKLQPLLDIKLRYSFLSKKDRDSIFGDSRNDNSQLENWSEFYRRYPDSGGHIQFSDVGFSNSGDQALVYFVHWCGSLCGSGHYVLLEKRDKDWIVEHIGMMWIY